MGIILTPFAWLLMFFYNLFQSYGLALVLFALWYTRPRSWAEVAGQRAFTSLNAQY